jgi:hypothetical protein
MSDSINFEIDALVARYQLHPDRQDIFVEGERDQGLVKAFLEKHGRRNVSVFSVSVVNVPPHLVLERSFPHPSRRSEVIALAMELESKGVSSRQAACVADADLEHIIPKRIVCSLLLLTDYASMELYAYWDETVHTVLLMVSPRTSSSGSGLLNDLASPLQFLFTVRATNVDLQFGLTWIESIDKFFSISGRRIWFDENEFKRRYLTMRLTAEKLQQFEARLREIQSILCSDARFRIRGNDFIKLLTWYLRKSERCRHLNEDSVRQMLYVTLRPEDLARQPMFSSLLARFAT